jgi:hypothetical protein
MHRFRGPGSHGNLEQSHCIKTGVVNADFVHNLQSHCTIPTFKYPIVRYLDDKTIGIRYTQTDP